MLKARQIKKMIDLKFYKVILLIAIPVMTQNFITALGQMIDNLMVSSLGESAIAAVGSANSIFFVVLFIMFGVSESIGIFIAQYEGAKNSEKQQQTFIIGLIATMIVVTTAFLVININKDQIIGFYTKDPEVARMCYEYIKIASFSYFFLGINVLIGASFRSIGKTKYPMYSGMVAICTNTFLNFCFLTGFLIFPQLGLKGVAIATITSRVVEMCILFFIIYRTRPSFLPNFKTFGTIPKNLVVQILKKGIPLTLNEFAWGLGMALLLGLYGAGSTQNLVAVNIAYTIADLFFVIMGGFAVAISVIVGQRLGAGKLYGARYIITKIYILGFFVGLFIAVVFFTIAPYVVLFYNVSEEAAYLAVWVMRILAISFPVYILSATSFFTLRSGGDTLSVLLLDMGIMYIVTIPLAFYFANYTDLNLIFRFALIQCVDLFKIGFGIYLVSKGHWIRKLS